MGKKVGILLWLMLFCAGTMRAQDGQPDDHREAKETSLREVFVAAKRRLSDTGIEKTVLDTARLRQNLTYSMADILTRHSTLFIKSYGRATESTAEFRGTSPSHTQVTWNGMKINSPILGTVDFSYIPAYFIDQATLLHGPSSLNIGSGGLGGAIELSTQPQFGKGWGAELTQGISSFRTYDEFVGIRYSNERWSSTTRLSYARSQNDFRYTNRDKMVDIFDDEGNLLRSYHPQERNKSGYFDDVNLMQEVSYKAGKAGTFGATAWYAWSLRGLPFLSVDYKDDASFRNEHKQQSLHSQLYWKRAASHWNSDVRAGYQQQQIGYDYSTRRNGDQRTITSTQSTLRNGQLLATFNWMPDARWMLTATNNTTYQHVLSNDQTPFHTGKNYDTGRWEESLSASVRYRPVERLSFSALVRQEVYGSSVAIPIPAFFADYILWPRINLVLKASVARNYRYPTLGDLYFQPGGNADLSPEKGVSYDGGLEMHLQRHRWTLKANATAFDSYISDWILWTPNNKGYWVPSNVRKVHNYGLEASGQADYRPTEDWTLSLSANYAYTPSINRGERLNANDASYGKQLCYVPLYSANASASVAWKGWTIGWQWVHYSERYTTSSNETQYITGRLLPYNMNDLSFEKAFQLPRVSLSFKAIVNNLLDNEYITVLSRPMPPRNYTLFVTLKY